MCSIPSCDIINKTGGPLIVIFKKYILHCTHARSTYCTSTGQEQRSPSNVYTTKKKTKCPHIFNNMRGSFGKSFIFIFFWVFSECVTASYTYTRLSSHAVKVRSGKKPQRLRAGRPWVSTASARVLAAGRRLAADPSPNQLWWETPGQELTKIPSHPASYAASITFTDSDGVAVVWQLYGPIVTIPGRSRPFPVSNLTDGGQGPAKPRLPHWHALSQRRQLNRQGCRYLRV